MKPAVWWACARKTAYSEKGAKKAIARHKDRWKQTRYAYQCPYCEHWHLTKKIEMAR